MPDFQQPTEKLAEIKALLAADKLEEAIQILFDIVDNDEIIVFSASTKRLTKALRQNRITFQEHSQERNKLIYNLLDLLATIYSEAFEKIPPETLELNEPYQGYSEDKYKKKPPEPKLFITYLVTEIVKFLTISI